MLRRVSICANAHLAMFVSPLHHLGIHLECIAVFGFQLAVEHLVNFRGSGCNCTSEDFTSCAIDRNIVAVPEYFVADFECFSTVVDDNCRRATDADLVHLTSNQCCMRRNTATRGKNTIRCDHASKVFWSCFNTAKDCATTLSSNCFSFWGGKADLTRGSTWTSWKTSCQDFCLLHCNWVEDRN